MAPAYGIDPLRLSETGWGVVFSSKLSPSPSRVREALGELLELRHAQAGELYVEYSCDPAESAYSFLSRNGAGPGPADPKRVPYYLLLVGSPADISFSFQTQLSVQYAVGRLNFDSVEEYARYAHGVVEAEVSGINRKRVMAFFGPENSGDRMTRQLNDELLEPLSRELEKKVSDWDIQLVNRGAATKAQLVDLLGGTDTPAFLMTGAHGMVFPPGHEAQEAMQGALVCSDWGYDMAGGSGSISDEYFFAAHDVHDAADLSGMMVFAFGCFTAGTPMHDSFDVAYEPAVDRTVLARSPFISALPNRLLGKPGGGALAVIGNIDRAWSLSWHLGPEGPQIETFLSSLSQLLAGQPVGHAMEYFSQRYAELAAQLSELLKEGDIGNDEQLQEIRRLKLATADAQNFVILGDPATRIQPVGRLMPRSFADDSRASRPRVEQARTGSAEDSRSARSRKIKLGDRLGALSDEVHDVDQLGYKYYIQAFADLISSPHTSPPLTIGVFGAWGVGKSFLLNGVKNELKGQRLDEGQSSPVRVHIVSFNAWEYSSNKEIWPGLIRKLV